MGSEIAKLKNENKRTKTSIAKMKSFHNARKLRGVPLNDIHGFNDPETVYKRKREQASFSKCDSDRRNFGGGQDYASNGSDSEVSSEGQS